MRPTVEGYSDFSTLFLFKLSPIDVHNGTMSHEKVVAHDPRFASAVSLGTLRPIARPPGGVLASVVAEHGTAPRLVESDPFLDLRAERVEDDTGIVGVVGHKLFLVEHASIPLHQLVGQIPVEESDEGLDARSV